MSIKEKLKQLLSELGPYLGTAFACDADRIARRIKTVKILRAAFDKWRIDKQLKAKQAKDKK